jgi:hypothetical protein
VVDQLAQLAERQQQLAPVESAKPVDKLPDGFADLGMHPAADRALARCLAEKMKLRAELQQRSRSEPDSEFAYQNECSGELFNVAHSRKTIADRIAVLGHCSERLRGQISPEVLDEFDRRCAIVRQQLSPDEIINISQVFPEDYDAEPVSIRRFVSDDHYLGKVLRESLYPLILDDLEQLFEGDFSEVILGGSVGWGKTRMAEIGVLYDVYRCNCLKDPAAAFGLIPGGKVAFVCGSVTAGQASRVMFHGIRQLALQCRYFEEPHCRLNRKIKTELRFENKNVVVYPVAAEEHSMLGEDVFGCSLDEMNFMERVERSKRSRPGDTGVFDQAAELYNRISVRMRSRYNTRGQLPGKLWLISSSRYPDDFTDRKEREAAEELRKNGKTLSFVRHYAFWQTHPKSKFTLDEKGEIKTFKVEVGGLTTSSRILDGTEENVCQERVINVPVDLRTAFERDIDKALRDNAGVATFAIKPFMGNRKAIGQMFEKGKKAGLRHPFSRMDVTLQEKCAPEDRVERLLPENLHWIDRQKTTPEGRPMVDRDRPLMERVLFPALRYAHNDLSKSGDATGMCVVHAVDSMKVQRWAGEQYVTEDKPVMQVELILRVVPPVGGQVDIPNTRAIYYLLREMGMQFGKITYDTWGSQESVKALQDSGFAADNYSVDREKTAYETLRTAINDGRVICYCCPELERELAQLEDAGDKVDHPPFAGASKDLADALAGAVYACEQGWAAGHGIVGLFGTGIVQEEPPTQRGSGTAGDVVSLEDIEREGIL